MKLKTLKDLELCCVKEDRADGGCHHAQKVLKKEAIKWVKSYFDDANSNRLPGKATARGSIYVLMNFFNITEDELK